MDASILIIGAGPSGLFAAYELSKRGHSCLILEARDRIGGRIHTFQNGAGHLLEAGAEFIHGDVPITSELVAEAGLCRTKTAGRWVQLRGGLQSEVADSGDWEGLLKKLKNLEQDITLQAFLETYYPGAENAALADRAIAYAEGFDTADASKASAKALGEEWRVEQGSESRITEGYGALVSHLAVRCQGAGSQMLLSHEATRVALTADGVGVMAGGKTFHVQRCIVALPLAVLQQANNLLPAAPEAERALASLGMGHVIKFLFTFRTAFWEDVYPDLGFLLSGEEVPTWWTQAPAPINTLTGWLSGRAAQAHAGLSEEMLRDAALHSLAIVFNRERYALESELMEARIVNWSADPFTRGSYAYATVGAEAAQAVLAQGIGSRIHFAGEYMYSGPAMGTVEAALWSGREAARRIID